MTAPLRRAHLAAWVVLAVALAAVLVTGFAGRRTPVTAPANPTIQWENYR